MNRIVFIALIVLLKPITCHSQLSKLWPNLSQSIKLPDGSYNECGKVYDQFDFSTKIEICDVYAIEKNKAGEKCRSKKIKGTETKDGLIEIRKICWSEGHKAGAKGVKWFLRKKKVKGFFK